MPSLFGERCNILLEFAEYGRDRLNPEDVKGESGVFNTLLAGVRTDMDDCVNLREKCIRSAKDHGGLGEESLCKVKH